MDIIVGSGNNRIKTTIASGFKRRQFAKTNPIEHHKDVGAIMALVRNGDQR